MNHEHYMRMAFDLARLGLGHTSPNPLVGAVLVKGNKIIGTGYHQKYGSA
ncbi:MAG: bifunctional diaminohydroxyphosphoribosylaminopyrimidine deaminase/5-amino-6-(5-phosphoribosylamino)uracil reductase RibD, partial [Bacteriovorax sp.]